MNPPRHCGNCRFLRRFRPLSQLLARDLGTNDQPVVAELLRIMQEERQQRDAEAELKAKLFENRDERWPYRPHVSDYCGVREARGEFVVHELRNRGGRCGEWKPGEEERRECSTCAHQLLGTGDQRDQRELQEIALVEQNAAALGKSAPSLAANYIQRAGTKKAFEAAQAYYAGRLTGEPPEYLSSCRKYSTSGNVIPCVAQNPNGSCQGWDAKAGQPQPTARKPAMMDALKTLARK